jgi:hypothetical protein
MTGLGAIVLTVLAVSQPVLAQQPVYKEYIPTPARELYFVVGFDKANLRIVVPTARGQEEILVGRQTLSTAGEAVTSAAMILFDRRGLVFNDTILPYEAISDIEISQQDRETEIRFFTSAKARAGTGAIRRGNRISYDEPVAVGKDDFVRGFVFSVKGGITVNGEVSKDVVSLFGDVMVAPQAVSRGSLASVTGSITVAKTAAVYGDTYSGTKKSWIRRHRIYRGEEELELLPRISYNRVDGFAPYLTVRYQDHDSTLPVAWGTLGYAFTSERLRFELGMEQRIMRTMALTLGAKYYRRLASADDWLVGDGENTAFALLVTEDFKDFYESEGGGVYLKAAPSKGLGTEVGLFSENTKWLKGHRNLWSLFGGNKRFGENFGTVDTAIWERGSAEIDSTTDVSLTTRLEYNGTNKENLFGRSAWRASATLEWSADAFGSDFDYRRYILQVRRYQKTTKQSILLLTGTYGASDGYMPMNRMFFLGGLGTLYGYRHKEYWGTRFWMTNAEYRFTLPRRDIALSLFWDCGQISRSTSFDDASDVKNSIGAALYLGRGFRLSVARRLDRSSDNAPEIYVRLSDIY